MQGATLVPSVPLVPLVPPVPPSFAVPAEPDHEKAGLVAGLVVFGLLLLGGGFCLYWFYFRPKTLQKQAKHASKSTTQTPQKSCYHKQGSTKSVAVFDRVARTLIMGPVDSNGTLNATTTCTPESSTTTTTPFTLGCSVTAGGRITSQKIVVQSFSDSSLELVVPDGEKIDLVQTPTCPSSVVQQQQTTTGTNEAGSSVKTETGSSKTNESTTTKKTQTTTTES